MKLNLIRTKVLLALIACLVIGVGGILALMQYSFSRNAGALAAESVTGAQRLFMILETRETSKMSAVGEMLIANDRVREAFAAKDRDRLLALTGPMYPELKKEGITNWMFHTPGPDTSVFLRLHNPAKFGDHLNRFMDTEIQHTHAPVMGNELAKAGFAVRVIRPVTDAQGKELGYVEFGEELGQFIHTMKEQTGDDYGLLLSKKYVDKQFWAESNAMWKRRDNWNDNPDFVVADKTTPSESIIKFDGDLGGVPAAGDVLERIHDRGSIFVRGIFPIHDAAGNTVGAMFVVHDISATYVAMQRTRNILVLVTVATLSLGMFLVLTLLDRLVFRRLDHIIRIATRVVGGDYESNIQVSSEDEVGQIELLFEQFRCVFVDVLSHVPEFTEK
jgi:Double sensory domain of two-component sensor kinase